MFRSLLGLRVRGLGRMVTVADTTCMISKVIPP